MKNVIGIILFLLVPMKWVAAEQTNYVLQVDGLVCPFCEYNVQKKLGKLDGVLQVKANLKDGVVNVLVADGKFLSEKQARQELTDAGFTLKSIQSHTAKMDSDKSDQNKH